MAAGEEAGDNVGVLLGTSVFSLVGDGIDWVLDNEEILVCMTLPPRTDVNADGTERAAGEFEDVGIAVGARTIESVREFRLIPT